MYNLFTVGCVQRPDMMHRTQSSTGTSRNNDDATEKAFLLGLGLWSQWQVWVTEASHARAPDTAHSSSAIRQSFRGCVPAPENFSKLMIESLCAKNSKVRWRWGPRSFPRGCWCSSHRKSLRKTHRLGRNHPTGSICHP
jgi:hypothetical protein